MEKNDNKKSKQELKPPNTSDSQPEQSQQRESRCLQNCLTHDCLQFSSFPSEAETLTPARHPGWWLILLAGVTEDINQGTPPVPI